MLRLPVETPEDLLGLLQNFVSIIVVLQFDDVLVNSYLGYFYQKPFKDSFFKIVYRERLRKNCLDKCRDKGKTKSATCELLMLNLTQPSQILHSLLITALFLYNFILPFLEQNKDDLI